MAQNIVDARFQLRYDTEANWIASNPVLLPGEIAISSDKNNKHKIGNGSATWSNLSYAKADLVKSDITSALGYTPPTTNTTYGLATSSTNGLVRIGYPESGKNYPVELNSSGQMFVNVPWANTTYGTGTSSSSGITKLYTGTGTATDGSMTQAAITSALNGKAPSSHTHNYAGSSSAGGNANAAVKLATARNINGVAFDGTANITITANPSTTTLTTQDLNNIKTPGLYVGGGSNTVLNKPTNIDAFGLEVYKTATGYIAQRLTGGNTNAGIVYIRQFNASTWSAWTALYSPLNKPTKADVGLSNVNNTADSAKSVANAAKLTTARSISLAGDVTGSASFDGSANISITATVADDSHNHVISNVDGLQTALDGKAATSHGTHVSFSSTAPLVAGTASVGTATTVARSDHRHPVQTSVSGNAGTATKLATARTLTIGNTGKTFDGSANVAWSLGDIGALPTAGGTMSGTINSSKVTNTYLAGSQGAAIINSTAGAGAYTALSKLNSTNGYFTDVVYQNARYINYMSKTTVDAGTNSPTKSVKLLDESGNTQFPGTVTAPTFSGTATKATGDKNGADITTKYVNVDGTQTVSGAKTFSNNTKVSKTTASTSKATGALVVSGGLGVAGQINAATMRVNEKWTMQVNSNGSLDFVLA